MLNADVVIIGGGATGAGILRDLCLRGVKAILVERGDLGCGTSSRFHGLLHSGARYAVRDRHAAVECIEENTILRRIAKSCVEPISSIFIRTPEDDPDYEELWVSSCRAAGISAQPLTVEQALEMEPNLSPKIQSAYLCPGAAIDGFRLLWHIFDSAKKLGGQVLTYTNVIGIDTQNGKVEGITVQDKFTHETYKIACNYLINATGPWCARVASLAGIDINIKPSKGTLIAFNHRISTNVIHRLHKPADADIFVPHGTVTILGTTSMDADPDDTSTTQQEVEEMMAIGRATFENLDSYRILRVFAGCRPLYAGDDKNASGRAVSRDFVALEHGPRDGLDNFMSVCGGKFTTHRQMAEKVCNIVCPILGNHEPCTTAKIPLDAEPDPALMEKARQVFPSYGTKLSFNRQGAERFATIVKKIEEDSDQGEIICECENVTRAEIEMVAKESTTHSISDLRRRTRLGMGTCQGTFCTYRAVGTVQEVTDTWTGNTKDLFKEFLEARWKGIRPVMWGNQIKDVELTRGIYEVSLNINHEDDLALALQEQEQEQGKPQPQTKPQAEAPVSAAPASVAPVSAAPAAKTAAAAKAAPVAPAPAATAAATPAAPAAPTAESKAAPAEKKSTPKASTTKIAVKTKRKTSTHASSKEGK